MLEMEGVTLSEHLVALQHLPIRTSQPHWAIAQLESACRRHRRKADVKTYLFVALVINYLCRLKFDTFPGITIFGKALEHAL